MEFKIFSTRISKNIILLLLLMVVLEVGFIYIPVITAILTLIAAIMAGIITLSNIR